MTTRRVFLSTLGGMLGLAALPASQAAEVSLAFSELYQREGELSAKCLGLAGRRVAMAGYMAPPLKAEADFFVLTSTPMAVCPFCETEAQWPDDIVLVLADHALSAVPFNRPIVVRGVLETGFQKDPDTGFVSFIRLVRADFERL